MTLRIATLNLYHFAEPGVFWYAREQDGGRTHLPEQWAAKCDWLRAILAQTEADVIGFQEVVSVAALAALCAEAGLPHLATVAEPHFLAEDPSVYNRPVNAVASRWPIRAEPVTPREGVARTLGLSHDRGFRRPPVRAAVETPTLGEILIYCCHLKSPGAAVTDALMAGDSQPPEAPDAAARWRLEGLSRAHGYAAIQRVAEASMLFHDVMARIAEAPSRPAVALGDFNDTPDSPTLSALTAYRDHERDGGAEAGAAAGDDPAPRYRLIDAWRLAPRALDRDDRPATHRDGAAGSAIDFALVSSALHPWMADRVGSVRTVHVHDAHFRRADPAASSDHAAVCVTLEAAAR